MRPPRPGGGRRLEPAHGVDMTARLEEASALMRAGQLEKSADAFRTVLKKLPGHAGATAGLAQALGRMGRLDDAARTLRPLAARSRDAVVHLVLADLDQQRGAVREALASAEKAADLDPRDPAAPRLVGLCLARVNRVDDAVAAVQRSLALAPGDLHSSILLGMLHRRRKDDEEARRLFEAALPRVARDPIARADLLHELGFVLDRMGEHDAAFEKFSEAGRIEEEIGRAKGIDFDFDRALVASYRRDLTAEMMTRVPADALAGDRRPLAFLVGFPRSGTTMTEQVLAAHPGVFTSDEEDVLRVVRDTIAGSRGDMRALVAGIAALDVKAVQRLRRLYWREADKIIPREARGKLFVDKFPLNIHHVGLINAVFPDAKLLVALRDPRDVCLSCFQQSFALNTGMINFTSLERAVAFYRDVMGYWLHAREMITLSRLEVRYEDTVRDLAGTARAILAHLDLPWDDAVLAFHELAKDRVISTPSAVAVTEPVHTRAIGRWRDYGRHFAPLLPALAPFVAAFGYEREPAPG